MCIWENYINSLTWTKAIWGWLPLLTMIPVFGHSEVVIIYPGVCIHRIHGAGIYANMTGVYIAYKHGIHVTIYSSTMDPSWLHSSWGRAKNSPVSTWFRRSQRSMQLWWKLWLQGRRRSCSAPVLLGDFNVGKHHGFTNNTVGWIPIEIGMQPCNHQNKEFQWISHIYEWLWSVWWHNGKKWSKPWHHFLSPRNIVGSHKCSLERSQPWRCINLGSTWVFIVSFPRCVCRL